MVIPTELSAIQYRERHETILTNFSTNSGFSPAQNACAGPILMFRGLIRYGLPQNSQQQQRRYPFTVLGEFGRSRPPRVHSLGLFTFPIIHSPGEFRGSPHQTSRQRAPTTTIGSRCFYTVFRQSPGIYHFFTPFTSYRLVKTSGSPPDVYQIYRGVMSHLQDWRESGSRGHAIYSSSEFSGRTR